MYRIANTVTPTVTSTMTALMAKPAIGDTEHDRAGRRKQDKHRQSRSKRKPRRGKKRINGVLTSVLAVARARVDDSELLRETERCGYKEPPQGHPTRRKHRGRNCLDASVGKEGLRERLGRTVSGDCAEAHDDGHLEAALAHDLGVEREFDLLFFKLASTRYAKPFEDPG